MTLSEEWFDRYVSDHGHDPGEPEPPLGAETKPDRLLTWNGVEVVCEIKQFDKDPFGDDWGRVAMADLKDVLKPVRRAIGYAAAQLKPLAGETRPLVVVLAKRARSPGSARPKRNDQLVE
jgi:hypothetical protein